MIYFALTDELEADFFFVGFFCFLVDFVCVSPVCFVPALLGWVLFDWLCSPNLNLTYAFLSHTKYLGGFFEQIDDAIFDIGLTFSDLNLDLFLVFEIRYFNFCPNGRRGWAAVMSFWSKILPLTVSRPWNPGPYQKASQPPCKSIGSLADFFVLSLHLLLGAAGQHQTTDQNDM